MDNVPINPVDGIIIAAVLLSGILALIRGLVREVLSLISWLLAIYAGTHLSPLLKPTMLKYTSNEMIANAAAGFIVFIIILVLLTIVSHIIAKSVRAAGLSAIDRSLGFLFGAARGFLVAALLYLCGTLIFTDKKEYPKWLTEAKTQPALDISAVWLQTLMPKDLQKDLDESRKNAKEGAEKLKANEETLKRLNGAVPGRTPDGEPGIEKAAKDSVPAAAPTPAQGAAPQNAR